jgi:hypothetical protein
MSDFKNGTYKLLYISTGGDYFPIGYLISNSFNEQLEISEINKGSWKNQRNTNQSYSISLSGLVSENNRSSTILTYSDLQTIKRKVYFNFSVCR